MIAGTSSGAIIGTLLCVGYTPREILDVLMDNLPSISTDSIDISRLFKSYGLYSNDRLINVISSMIERKTMGVLPTFVELYDLFKRDLIITGTNVSTQNVAYFDRFTSPHMSVMDALKISTCIPFVFPYVEHEGQVFVDGGLTDNLPIEYANRYADKYLTGVPVHALNLRYTYTIEPTTLLNFVICIMKIFSNNGLPESLEQSGFVHTLQVDVICPLTTTDADEVSTLFQRGLVYTNLFKTQETVEGTPTAESA